MLSDPDIVGTWTEVKLAILREYAVPYSQILSAKGFYHLYLDAFAAGGSHISRTTGEIVPGSPLNALATQPPFKEYQFIDKTPARVQPLKSFVGNRRDVHIYEGDCNQVLLNEVFPKVRYEDYRRALCVLDPYNIGLSWNVVATAGRMRSIEIFLNFMIMDMNMNVLLSDPKRATSKQRARMTRFWGDESWHGIAYEDDPQDKLFGDRDQIKVDQANEKMADAYRRRLLDVAGFKYAPRPLPLHNSLGRTIYYLFFASPDPTANKIVQGIFAKYRHKS